MTNFIADFYYGNIEPQERSTRMNKSAQKQLEIMVNSEETPEVVCSCESGTYFRCYQESFRISKNAIPRKTKTDSKIEYDVCSGKPLSG